MELLDEKIQFGLHLQRIPTSTRIKAAVKIRLNYVDIRQSRLPEKADPDRKREKDSKTLPLIFSSRGRRSRSYRRDPGEMFLRKKNRSSRSPSLSLETVVPLEDQNEERDDPEDRWSRLLPDLLGEIVSRLESSEDQWPLRKNVVSCASVCKKWREITRNIVRPPRESGRITFPSSLKQVFLLDLIWKRFMGLILFSLVLMWVISCSILLGFCSLDREILRFSVSSGETGRTLLFISSLGWLRVSLTFLWFGS